MKNSAFGRRSAQAYLSVPTKRICLQVLCTREGRRAVVIRMRLASQESQTHALRGKEAGALTKREKFSPLSASQWPLSQSGLT